MGIGAFAHLSERGEFGTEELRARNDEVLREELRAVFLSDNVDGWLGRLRAAGINAVRNDDVEYILGDDYPRQQGLIVEEDNPQLGTVIHAGVAPRLSRTQPTLGMTPTFGEETEAVLLELGYEVGEIDALRDDGVIPPLG